MMGSPASRGAAASLGGGAGRACLGAASAVSAVSAAIAASVNTERGPQRRIAVVDCSVENRVDMLCPVEEALFALAQTKCQITTFLDLTAATRHQLAPEVYRPIRWQFSHIRQRVQEEGWLAAGIGPETT